MINDKFLFNGFPVVHVCDNANEEIVITTKNPKTLDYQINKIKIYEDVESDEDRFDDEEKLIRDICRFIENRERN